MPWYNLLLGAKPRPEAEETFLKGLDEVEKIMETDYFGGELKLVW